MLSPIRWFEIPTLDLDRATRFYEQVLGVQLKRETFNGIGNAVFPFERPAPGGALFQDPQRKPGTGALTVYLTAEGQLDACLARVPKAGGEIVLPRTSIGDPGYIALFRDTEGNVVGLHSRV